jgi:hypothetical protein
VVRDAHEGAEKAVFLFLFLLFTKNGAVFHRFTYSIQKQVMCEDEGVKR